MIGLHFSERMQGTWYRLTAPGDELPIAFKGTATIERLADLFGKAIARFEGSVTVDGLARDASMTGTIGLGALLREKRLPYAFSFRADDGRLYRFDGTKEVALRDIARSMTTLPAYVFDDAGDEVGRAVLHFDTKGDLLSFLLSWGLVLGRRTARAR